MNVKEANEIIKGKTSKAYARGFLKGIKQSQAIVQILEDILKGQEQFKVGLPAPLAVTFHYGWKLLSDYHLKVLGNKK